MVIILKERLNVLKCMFEVSRWLSCYVWEYIWRGVGGGGCMGILGWGLDGGGLFGGVVWCWGLGGKLWYGVGFLWVGFIGVGWLL